MFFLPFLPLTTAMVSMLVLTINPKCYDFDCVDLVQDSLDCDVCWCYEEGGLGCFCCTACHDDSSDAFHAYAK